MSQSAAGDFVSNHTWPILAVASTLVSLLTMSTFYYWRRTRLIIKEIMLKSAEMEGEHYAANQRQVFDDPMTTDALLGGEKDKGGRARHRLTKANSMTELEPGNLEGSNGNGSLGRQISNHVGSKKGKKSKKKSKFHSLDRDRALNSNHVQQHQQHQQQQQSYQQSYQYAQPTETQLIQQCFASSGLSPTLSMGNLSVGGVSFEDRHGILHHRGSLSALNKC